MKKDDLFLAGLYILLLPVFFIFSYWMNRMEAKPKLEAKAAIEKLYENPVNVILIKNTMKEIDIQEKDQLATSCGFEFEGIMEVEVASKLRVVGDTLLIDGPFQDFPRTLWKTSDVKVDTVNAPQVVFGVREISKDTIQDGL